MVRCYAEPKAWVEGRVTLSPAESHHLLHVMRAGVGDTVMIFDGAGVEAVARLARSAGKIAELEVAELRRQPRPAPAITILQALIREQKMDMVVEKGAELGASRIVPVAAERSIVRLAAKAADSRVERWNKIALSAAKQCGGNWLMRIDPVVPLAVAVRAAPPADLLLVASLEKDAVPLKTVMGKAASGTLATVSVLIGPEGDLTPAELSAAKAAGAVPVSLGHAVLRAETAAICALSILKYELSNLPA
ncbi:MAG: RsmE family RNA methyltransferase [bacterium]